MLDLVILIILVRRIVKYAKEKGQPTLKWGIFLVLNWFMFEMLGIAFATYFLEIKIDLAFIQTNPGYTLLLSFFGIGCGFLGYFTTRKMLDRALF